ncbi:hypothetical protein HYV30_04465 [Candidatus Kaiserbacteria bacterium]|nr:hypothetical protein [Candidatus Kaiserbacteria bacterium]
MSRASTLILLGLLTILIPYSGLPSSIRSLGAVILGAAVASIGVALRAHDVRKKQESSDRPPNVS